ncbi:MAG: hypothetical protein ACLQNE_25875 [Thermoguttaceae bacterium]
MTRMNEKARLRGVRQSWAIWLVAVSCVAAAEPALKRSDVVFMYQSGRSTPIDCCWRATNWWITR